MLLKIVFCLLLLRDTFGMCSDNDLDDSFRLELPDLTLLFWNETQSSMIKIQLSETSKLLQDETFKSKSLTVLIIHGFKEDYRNSNASSRIISDAYIVRGDHNILAVDWASYAEGSYYATAMPNSLKVGKVLGKKFAAMKTEGFNVENFHIVSVSLGCHLAAFAARTAKENSQGKLEFKRITALDPAGPGFYPTGLFKPLNKFDGKFH